MIIIQADGIYIDETDWILMEDNRLKKLYEINKDGKNFYSLNTDNGKILRGAINYFGLIAFKDKEKGKLCKKEVLNWQESNNKFFEGSKIVLENDKLDLNDRNIRKLVLGVLDNIRNVSILSLNSIIYNDHSKNNSIIEYDKLDKDDEMYKWYKIIEENSKDMNKLLFEENIEEGLDKRIGTRLRKCYTNKYSNCR